MQPVSVKAPRRAPVVGDPRADAEVLRDVRVGLGEVAADRAQGVTGRSSRCRRCRAPAARVRHRLVVARDQRQDAAEVTVRDVGRDVRRQLGAVVAGPADLAAPAPEIGQLDGEFGGHGHSSRKSVGTPRSCPGPPPLKQGGRPQVQRTWRALPSSYAACPDSEAGVPVSHQAPDSVQRGLRHPAHHDGRTLLGDGGRAGCGVRRPRARRGSPVGARPRRGSPASGRARRSRPARCRLGAGTAGVGEQVVEAVGTLAGLQPVDHREAGVVAEHGDVGLPGERGGVELGVEHQVGAVAEDRGHHAVGVGRRRAIAAPHGATTS